MTDPIVKIEHKQNFEEEKLIKKQLKAEEHEKYVKGYKTNYQIHKNYLKKKREEKIKLYHCKCVKNLKYSSLNFS